MPENLDVALMATIVIVTSGFRRLVVQQLDLDGFSLFDDLHPLHPFLVTLNCIRLQHIFVKAISFFNTFLGALAVLLVQAASHAKWQDLAFSAFLVVKAMRYQVLQRICRVEDANGETRFVNLPE